MLFLVSKFVDVVRMDTSCPFGIKAAPGLFSDVTVLISRMLQSRGFPGVVVYLNVFCWWQIWRKLVSKGSIC